MRPERELLKGSTPTLILAVLADGPRHGYGIAREIERRSGEALSLGEGSLYPALHGLERDGLLSATWETPPTRETRVPGVGPARKVYTLTDAGRAELAKRTRTWREFVDAIEGVLSPPATPGNGGIPDVGKPRTA